MNDAQSGAVDISKFVKEDDKPKIGRKKSKAFEELNFELSKEHGKYEAICKLCNKRLQNTAASRLQSHRNKCNISADGTMVHSAEDNTPVPAKKLKLENTNAQDISIDEFLEHTATYNVNDNSAWSEEEFMPPFAEAQADQSREFGGENDESKLKMLLQNFDMDFLLPFLKAADITYRSLRYLSVEDINAAIRSIGFRAEFREKLFAWRRKKFTINNRTKEQNNELNVEPLCKIIGTKRKRSDIPMSANSESDMDESISSDMSNAERSAKIESTSISVLSQFNINDVINQSYYGSTIKDFYAKHGYLHPAHRDELIQVIVDFLLTRDMKVHCADFDKIMDEIVDIFPRENKAKDYYYIPRKPKGNPMGRLYTRYYNAVRKKRLNHTFEERRRASDASSKDLSIEEHISADQSLDEPSIKAIKSFLRCDGINFEDARIMWDKTCTVRMKDRQRMSTNVFLQQWPKYLAPRGSELFKIDFNLKFPLKNDLLYKKWPEFKTKIYQYYNANIRDEACKSLYAICRAQPGEILEEYLLLALLNSILPPTACFKDSVGTNHRKPTISDAVDCFAIWTPTLDKLEQRKRDIIKKYNYNIKQLLPDIVIVGENNLNIREIYVSFDSALYAVPDFLRAIDVCMHIYRVLSLPYPQTIEYPWILIQHYFYEILLPDDAKCPALISLFSYLSL